MAKKATMAGDYGKTRSAKADEDTKVMAKGTFWGLAGGLAFKIFSFIYTIILVRLFTQEDVGIFYLALSIFYSVAILADLGLNNSFARYVPYYMGKGEKGKAYTLLQGAYIYCGVLALAFLVAIVLSAGFLTEAFHTPGLYPALLLVAFLPLLTSISAINLAFIGGLKMIKEGQIASTLQNVAKLALMFCFLALIGSSATSLTAAFVASFLVLTALSFWYVKKGMKAHKIEPVHSTLKEKTSLVKEAATLGIALAVVTGVSSLAFYTDRILLGYLLPPQTSAPLIAVYSIAVSLAMLIQIFPGAVLSIFSPVIAELYGKGDREGMAKTSRTAVRWYIFLLTPLSIVFIVFPSELLGVFYGSAYSTGGTVFSLFAIGLFLRHLTLVQGAILASMRIVRVELFAGLIALAFNFVFDWFYIPIYGMEGAAAVSAVSMAIASVIVIYYCKKLFGHSLLNEMKNPVLAFVAALVVVYLARGLLVGFADAATIPVPIEGILGIAAQKFLRLAAFGLIAAFATAVYFAFLLLLKEFKEGDVAVLSGFLRRAKAPGEFVALTERVVGWGGYIE